MRGRIQRSAGVETVFIDGEAVLFEMATARVHRLHGAANRIWAALDAPRPFDELAAVTAVDRSELEAFMTTLTDLGLVELAP